MRISLTLRGMAPRLAIIIAASIAAAYIGLSAARFIASVISDPAVRAETEDIERAANYFPNSARIQARMASRLIESGVSQAEGHELVAERAVYYASRAVSLSPKNYEFRILSATAREMNGALDGAEAELRAALALAPHHADTHWRLANLLIREDKLDQAIGDFRAVIQADPGRLTTTLDLLWQASDGKIETLKAVVGGDTVSQLTLARFLVREGMYEAAVKICAGLDRRSFLDIPEMDRLLDSLITAGQVDLASRLWRDLFGAGAEPLIWNESFETPLRSGFAQFDWNISQSKYAGIGITSTSARTGRRSLKIVYLGIDTTRLDDEVRQLVVTRPGSRYVLTCYAKAENLITPEAPRVVVTAQGSTIPIATSEALEAGTYDGRPLSVEFTAPPNARAVVVSIKQIPQFSYVAPTRGTVWFDDFVLTER